MDSFAQMHGYGQPTDRIAYRCPVCGALWTEDAILDHLHDEYPHRAFFARLTGDMALDISAPVYARLDPLRYRDAESLAVAMAESELGIEVSP